MFMEPRDSHHPSIFVRGSHRGGVCHICIQQGAGLPSNFPGEKKKHASDWNGTSFASDSLVTNGEQRKRLEKMPNLGWLMC